MRASETRAIATSPRADAGATRVSHDARPGARTAWPRPSETVTVRRLTGVRRTRVIRDRLAGSATVCFVCLDDLLDERVAHDVLLVEVDEGDPLHVADHLHGLDET